MAHHLLYRFTRTCKNEKKIILQTDITTGHKITAKEATMKKTLTTLTVLIIACCFSVSAFATPPNQGKEQKGRQFQAGPNLTEKQQTQLKALHQKFIDDTYEMRSGIMTLNQQIRMYMETSNPDYAKLKSMVTEKADLQKDLAVKRMEFALDARKISPELKCPPMGFMGMDHGMGPGPHHDGSGRHGFAKGGHGNGPGPRMDCPRWTNNNNAPDDRTSPENN